VLRRESLWPEALRVSAQDGGTDHHSSSTRRSRAKASALRRQPHCSTGLTLGRFFFAVNSNLACARLQVAHGTITRDAMHSRTAPAEPHAQQDIKVFFPELHRDMFSSWS
jgi:hypothetical protein